MIQGRSEFTLLEKTEYLRQLEQLIPRARQRVWIQTMTFDGVGNFIMLKRLLKHAAERGVDTRFTVDMYYKLIVGDSLYYLPQLSRSKREKVRFLRKKNDDALADLEKSNVLVIVTNPPRSVKEKLNPASGRNHIKMAIIDDTAFIGDIHHFVSKDQLGFMIRVTDYSIVRGLGHIYQTADKGRGGNDYEIMGEQSTSLLVDQGAPRQSLIMERFREVVDNARMSIRVTGQYTPDKKIAKILQTAQDRGVQASVLVADNREFGVLSRLFDARSQFMLAQAHSTVPILNAGKYIHSNILLVDETLPTAQVIVGTRCFSETLVDWGTQEIALQSQDSILLSQLSRYVDTLAANASVRNTKRTIREIIRNGN